MEKKKKQHNNLWVIDGEMESERVPPHTQPGSGRNPSRPELLFKTAFVPLGHRECVCFRKTGLEVNKYRSEGVSAERKREGESLRGQSPEACSPRRHCSVFFFFLLFGFYFRPDDFYLHAASVKFA